MSDKGFTSNQGYPSQQPQQAQQGYYQPTPQPQPIIIQQQPQKKSNTSSLCLGW
nr:14903_t:CDS:2 [Entrophospora candida]CAG8570558.1 11817_t:CDS:2 [Entrophospora candida]